ncbi:ribbon-helix-helix domain-containing protein [Kiloniella antarctica]|uniref:Type II toxin-antitoxin system ParD family antitoxin n=1 Tax=Kiloniella antarctica TaxID=1550907 RepID=A0ABW5BK21_9PROT
MPRQSITFTDPNSEWLRTKVDVEGEYSSNSEVVNDQIRKARVNEQAEINAVRAALRVGEESGISNKTLKDIIKAVMERQAK